MVSFNSIVIVAVISLATQASAGNPIAKFVAHAAGAAVGQAASQPQQKMRRVARDVSSAKSTFDQCLNAVHGSHITKAHNPDQSVTIGGLPQICINEVQEWNKQPNIADLNKSEGPIAVVNDTAITISGLKSDVSALLESI